MDGSFHYFPQLPPELRLIIWELCLPYRIAEEDEAYFLLDGNESRQACDSMWATDLNIQPPVIAFVNFESRQVALKKGHRLLETADALCLNSLWVQPRRDVLHLNWVRERYIIWGSPYGGDGPMYSLLSQAESEGMQPSIVAEVIHSFDLKALLDDPDSSVASEIPRHMRYVVADNIDVFDIVFYAMFCTERQLRLDVTMVAVSLHIPREAALNSGLFGLLGDAPVQMVDVGDHIALREFEALFRQHALDKEPAVQTLFDLFTSSRFETAVETWVKQAEWCLLLGMWWYAREDIGPNPGSAWIPYLPEYYMTEKKRFYMSQFLPNEKHPWLKEVRQSMPKLRPRIMVRYCYNMCYIKERLPKNFGSY